MASRTFGQIRDRLAQTIDALYEEKMTPERGLAIAANAKVLNDNVLAEIKANDVARRTSNELHRFGRVIGMGRRKIGDDGDGNDDGAIPALT